jgi:hypothetical protein
MRRIELPRLMVSALASTALAGCLAQPPGDDCDGPDDPACGLAIEGLSRPGNYAPSADALAAGSEIVPYDDVPAWDGGAHCSGGFTDGGRTLSSYLREHFDGISSIGGYSCRQNTANPAKMSVHGSGRALDIMIPLSSGAADNDVGDEIANWLIAHSTEIGVQYLIWDRTQWSGSRTSDRVRPYTGPNPHIDHLHVEITLEASREETAWYTGGGSTEPVTPPEPARPQLDARFVTQGADAATDTTGAAQYTACAGDPVTFWFEVEDTGVASWVDVDDTRPTGWGRAVRLGVPGDGTDPFTGVGRVSLDDSSNVDVHPATYTPPGPDCNDATYCRRTVFTLHGTMPSAPGIHRTSWRLVDETRAWFGPEMWLSFRVADCAPAPDPEPTPEPVIDADGDGVEASRDCDDTDADVHPGADELCEDTIDADCDGVDPACDTPSMPTPDPDIDDPGFDWSHGEPVHTGPTRHGIQSSCSASPGRGSVASLIGLLLALALVVRRRVR